MMGLAIHITTIIAHFRPDLTAQICTPKDRRGWKAQGPDGEELRDGYAQGRSQEDV